MNKFAAISLASLVSAIGFVAVPQSQAADVTILCASVNVALASNEVGPGRGGMKVQREFINDDWKSLPAADRKRIENCFAQPSAFVGRFFKMPVPFIKGLSPNASKVKVDLEICWPNKNGKDGVRFVYHYKGLPSAGRGAPAVFSSGTCKL
ncbi:MAG TPA: hypothetical protein VIL84_07850 [Devosiaceae bacterium]